MRDSWETRSKILVEDAMGDTVGDKWETAGREVGDKGKHIGRQTGFQGSRWETSWETSRLQRPAWRQVEDKVGNKARQGSQSSRWATLWQTRFGGSWWETKWDTPGDKIPRFRELGTLRIHGEGGRSPVAKGWKTKCETS